MKNIYLIGLCWLSTTVFSSLFAQTSTTVYTPKGSAVAALVFQEFTSAEITQVNNLAANEYPNATRLADASKIYNCHAYAWHLSEGSTNKVWINTPGDDTYWNDGSFIQVCNESDASKVSYASDDHSAMRSAQSIPLGRYDSKWGAWPLLRHAPTYTPYNSTTRKYYVSTKVNGPSYVCYTNSSFTATAITGATYTWTKSSNIVLSGSGNTISAKAASGASGTGWVQVTINSPCGGTLTTRKNINVGSFASYQMTFSGQPDVCPGGLYQYTVGVPGGHQPGYTYTWTYPSGWTVESQGNGTIRLYVTSSASYGALRVTVNTGCGEPVSTGITVYPSYSCGTGTYAVYPNPADEQLNIEQVNEQKFIASVENDRLLVSSTAVSPEWEEFQVKLYSEQQKQVAEAASKKGKITLDTSKLPAGTYFLHILHQHGALRKQVIIQ